MTTPSQLKFYGSQTLNDNWAEERAPPLRGVIVNSGPVPDQFTTCTSLAFAPRPDHSSRAHRQRLRAAKRGTWPNTAESMVQVSTFDEVVQQRDTGKPETGIFATLPRHPNGHDARILDTMAQASYGVGKRMTRTAQRMLHRHDAPAAGARVASTAGISSAAAGSGDGLAGEVMQLGEDPQNNTPAQRTWMYAADPSVTLRMAQRADPSLTQTLSNQKQDWTASLPIGTKDAHEQCKPGPRVSTTLTKGGGGIFMDDEPGVQY